jgi:hypothetical protein
VACNFGGFELIYCRPIIELNLVAADASSDLIGFERYRWLVCRVQEKGAKAGSLRRRFASSNSNILVVANWLLKVAGNAEPWESMPSG